MYIAIIKNSIIRSIVLNVSSKSNARNTLVSLFGDEYVESNVISINKFN